MRQLLALAAVASLVVGCMGVVDNGYGHVAMPDHTSITAGRAFTIQTDWERTCRKRSCVKDGYHDGPIEEEHCSTEVGACDSSPYDIEVTCTGPSAKACPHDRLHTNIGTLEFSITPTEPGPLAVHITLVQKGGAKLSEDATWDVREDPTKLSASVPPEYAD